jgi:ABC-type Mn2+/Zn2+ transport system ATPase subunit
MILSAENLSFGAGGRELAAGLNFSLHSGEVLHVSGANGAGKSQLLRVILGLHGRISGEIRFAPDAFPYRYLPQTQNRASHLPYSLGEVLEFSASANLLIEESRLALSWNKASGGERQRVLLSRFFSQPGNLLLLDEPFNHLDTAAKEKVRALLRETLKSQPRAAAILVSHDDQPATWLGGIPVRELFLKGEV